MDDSYKLKKLIKELESKRGRHTELISLYIPKDYSLNEINNLLANEISLTENVKSKTVRNNVIDALTKIKQNLQLYKKTPDNGLVMFCGNVSEQEGKSDMKIWIVEPPQPIKIKLYWCDQTFELAHL
ncbi:MAG: peptide chain release factor 1, partial [Candidatus Aenigmarchaeota archaeon]|nr:peptide chain release factor 1 [Candidatus Aenigmarchaeota archaeon]